MGIKEVVYACVLVAAYSPQSAFVDRHKFLRCKIGKKANQKSTVSTKERAIFRIFLMFLFALKLNALDDAADKNQE